MIADHLRGRPFVGLLAGTAPFEMIGILRVGKEIAAALGIAVRTVETHRGKIMLKLSMHSLADLIRNAIRNKIVPA